MLILLFVSIAQDQRISISVHSENHNGIGISNITTQHSIRNKRTSRTGSASLPLLQRAGLGLDVQRAFAVDAELVEDLEPSLSRGGARDLSVVDQVTEPRHVNNFQKNLLLRGESPTHFQNMHKDDSDSGLGPSGSSQIFIGFEKLTDAWKVYKLI